MAALKITGKIALVPVIGLLMICIGILHVLAMFYSIVRFFFLILLGIILIYGIASGSWSYAAQAMLFWGLSWAILFAATFAEEGLCIAKNRLTALLFK